MSSKVCTRCKTDKPLEEYYNLYTMNDGKMSHCKACHYDYTNAWKAKNRERALEIKRESAKRNYYKNPLKARKYDIRKRNATPSWADTEKIKRVYKMAKEYRDKGIDAEVDHIVPLKGENVCGLHVSWNMQIINRRYNISKNNRWSY